MTGHLHFHLNRNFIRCAVTLFSRFLMMSLMGKSLDSSFEKASSLPLTEAKA